MEKNYFATLDLHSKTELTWHYGELIRTAETRCSYISLFRLDTFFVEIHMHKFSNELIDANVQEDAEILYEYIREVNLDLILSC